MGEDDVVGITYISDDEKIHRTWNDDYEVNTVDSYTRHEIEIEILLKEGTKLANIYTNEKDIQQFNDKNRLRPSEAAVDRMEGMLATLQLAIELTGTDAQGAT